MLMRWLVLALLVAAIAICLCALVWVYLENLIIGILATVPIVMVVVPAAYEFMRLVGLIKPDPSQDEAERENDAHI